jgi:hypothetical protein
VNQMRMLPLQCGLLVWLLKYESGDRYQYRRGEVLTVKRIPVLTSRNPRNEASNHIPPHWCADECQPSRLLWGAAA